MKNEDPVEAPLPTHLKKSVNESTLIFKRGFEDGVDGDYIVEDPNITEAVYNRVSNLRKDPMMQISSMYPRTTLQLEEMKSMDISGSGVQELFMLGNGKYLYPKLEWNS